MPEDTSQQSKTTPQPTSSLGQIKEKEQEADEMIKNAQKRAEELIAQAKDRAEKDIQAARELNDEDIKLFLNQAKDKITSIQAETKAKIEMEVKNLQQIPPNKIDQAVDLAITKLMLKHNLL